MFKQMTVVVVLALPALIACGESVEPHDFTAEEAAAIDEEINDDMEFTGYSSLTEEEFMVICSNFKLDDWDYGLVLEKQIENDASNRSQFAHRVFRAQLWIVAGGGSESEWDEAAPSYIAGYCAHHLEES